MYYIDIQQTSQESLPVSHQDITQWAELALRDQVANGELSIRLVDKEEITDLNKTYRDKDKATNVLAFPFKLPEIIELDTQLLGDIIICPEMLVEESEDLSIPLKQHWAHIVIHGVLHLLGYDHIKDTDARKMHALEAKLLADIGFDNPYEGEDEIHD